MNIKKTFAAGLAAAASIVISPASAEVLDFSTVSNGFQGSTSLEVGDATITSLAADLFVYAPGDFGALGQGGFCFISGNSCTGDGEITFDYAVTDLSFNAQFVQAGDDVSIQLFNGFNIVAALSITTDMAIDLGGLVVTSIFFGDNGSTSDGMAFTNFSFSRAGVSDVPLPAALPLFLAGLGGLSIFRRRKTA